MAALAIAQGHGVPEIVARVLAGRGVAAETVERFPRPDHPRPAARSGDADRHGRGRGPHWPRRSSAGEKVAIFGDYDVDGAASSALLKRFLAHFGVESEIYIPDRIFEGYGPNPDAMRELVTRGATPDRHRRLRHQQRGVDRGGAAGRRRCGRARPPSGRRRACRQAVAGRQSEPRGRPFRAGPSLRGRRRLPRAGPDGARAARARPDLPQPDLLACSTWSRWRPSATWCR